MRPMQSTKRDARSPPRFIRLDSAVDRITAIASASKEQRADALVDLRRAAHARATRWRGNAVPHDRRQTKVSAPAVIVAGQVHGKRSPRARAVGPEPGQ